MAARRLLIVMLILLGISSAIAIIVPEPERDDPPTGETSPATGATGDTGTTDTDTTAGAEDGNRSTPPTERDEMVNGVREVTVNLDANDPTRIEAEPGARIIVSVTSTEGSEVEIQGLGLTGFSDPFAPAVFDLILPPKPGTFQVRAPETKPSAVIKTTS